MAYFPDTKCDFLTHFGPHNIIINLTFCTLLLFSLYKGTHLVCKRWRLGWKLLRLRGIQMPLELCR